MSLCSLFCYFKNNQARARCLHPFQDGSDNHVSFLQSSRRLPQSCISLLIVLPPSRQNSCKAGCSFSLSSFVTGNGDVRGEKNRWDLIKGKCHTSLHSLLCRSEAVYATRDMRVFALNVQIAPSVMKHRGSLSYNILISLLGIQCFTSRTRTVAFRLLHRSSCDI